MTDYHELPEVPRCCAGCSHWRLVVRYSRMHDISEAAAVCDILKMSVAPHGLCSHWERRDDGG